MGHLQVKTPLSGAVSCGQGGRQAKNVAELTTAVPAAISTLVLGWISLAGKQAGKESVGGYSFIEFLNQPSSSCLICEPSKSRVGSR